MIHLNKSLAIMVSVVVALGVGGLLVWRLNQIDADGSVVKSDQGKIRLENVQSGMVLKNDSSINGTFEAQSNAALYYVVSGSDKRALGAGSIAFEEDSTSFSRNLAFDAKNYQGKEGELYIYMQDDQGQLVDGARVTVRFE